jgi:DNA polymerase I
VHDELVFETESEFLETLRTQVVELMSSSAQLRVPLVVDAGSGSNWDEAH